jgi:hypothetical protein
VEVGVDDASRRLYGKHARLSLFLMLEHFPSMPGSAVSAQASSSALVMP